MLKTAVKLIPLVFLTILLNSCAKSSLVVKAEYVKEKIPAELLEAPHFELKEVKNEQEILAEFVTLFSFYKDIKNKLEKIKALSLCESEKCLKAVLESKQD